MYLLRTRFKKEIVCEFLPPARKSLKAVILCGGMPAYPAKKDLAIFLAKKGFWVFLPRYRGSWESGGKFLKKSPHKDIIDIIDELAKGFKSLWDGKIYKVKPARIYLIGSSFGGAAVLLASQDSRVVKVMAFSPVIDWRVESKEEPVDFMAKFVKLAFGNGYRFSQKDWNKLKTGKFYNPMSVARKIDGNKIFIIAAKDDKIVPIRPAKNFAKITKCKILLLKKGGHLSMSYLAKPRFYKKFKEFIGSK